MIGEPDRRGRGIGRAVVRRLVERGRAIGYNELFVAEIYRFNIASQRLFESAGSRRDTETEKDYRNRLRLQEIAEENDSSGPSFSWDFPLHIF